jgi:hypothetical protein
LQANVSFINQALKGVPIDFQIQQLDRYQAVTKDGVIAALREHLMPLFDPKSSVAVVVAAPGRFEEVGDGLAKAGFKVEKETLEVDPNEQEDNGSDGDDESDSGSDAR